MSDSRYWSERKSGFGLALGICIAVSCRFSLCAVELPASCAGAAVRAPASQPLKATRIPDPKSRSELADCNALLSRAHWRRHSAKRSFPSYQKNRVQTRISRSKLICIITKKNTIIVQLFRRSRGRSQLHVIGHGRWLRCAITRTLSAPLLAQFPSPPLSQSSSLARIIDRHHSHRLRHPGSLSRWRFFSSASSHFARNFSDESGWKFAGLGRQPGGIGES